jgi:hypothetical protein
MKDWNNIHRLRSTGVSKKTQTQIVLPEKRGRLGSFSIGAVLLGGLIFSFVHHEQGLGLSKESVQPQQPKNQTPYSVSLADLTKLSSVKLEHIDIAYLNLRCAQRLPGAGEISISNQLATLDQWAKRVQTETERHLYRFRANPQEYYSSEGYFRMLMMAVVFYEDFNIRYNPERMSRPDNINPNDRFFADSRDIFLHGLIADRRMGTCSSMPVLYAAVGRRLGYPLKLVTTKAHLFLRWEDAKERFNLEATGRGMNRYDDEHFKQWPFPVTDEEIRAEGYLKSLTAAEELAVFLSLRGMCQAESGHYPEAAESFDRAAKLAPGCRTYGKMRDELKNKSLLQAVGRL